MTRTTFDPGFDSRIADWLEEDPDRAPDAVLETVLAAFPSIPQRRAWRVPWRLRPMSLSPRVVAAAMALVIVAGGGLLILRPGASQVGTVPAPTPSPSPSGPRLADGTYAGIVQQAGAIRAAVQADTTLGPNERTAVIETVLGIGRATTYQTRIQIHGATMVVSQIVDDAANPETWTIKDLGGDHILARWANGTIEFRVSGCETSVVGCSFTMTAVSAAPSPVEGFVRRTVFETGGPFSLMP